MSQKLLNKFIKQSCKTLGGNPIQQAWLQGEFRPLRLMGQASEFKINRQIRCTFGRSVDLSVCFLHDKEDLMLCGDSFRTFGVTK